MSGFSALHEISHFVIVMFRISGFWCFCCVELVVMMVEVYWQFLHLGGGLGSCEDQGKGGEGVEWFSFLGATLPCLMLAFRLTQLMSFLLAVQELWRCWLNFLSCPSTLHFLVFRPRVDSYIQVKLLQQNQWIVLLWTILCIYQAAAISGLHFHNNEASTTSVDALFNYLESNPTSRDVLSPLQAPYAALHLIIFHQ